MSESDLDNLIDELTSDLKPVKPMMHPAVRLLPFFIGFMVYVWVIVNHIGLRADYVSKLLDLYFLFEVSIVSLIGLTSGLCGAWMCVPDMRGQRWMLPIPFVFISVFLLWMSLRSYVEGIEFPHVHFDHCMEDGLWMAALPAALMVYICTRGATTRPVMSAAMTIICVTAFAYVGLRFTCMMDSVGHATIYHLLPFVTLGTVFGLLARRIFSW